MITELEINKGDAYLVPDAEHIYSQPSIEKMVWWEDAVDISVFRHIGAYVDSPENRELAEFHLEIITRLFPNAPATRSWTRPSPSENTLAFRKWVDDYVL